MKITLLFFQRACSLGEKIRCFYRLVIEVVDERDTAAALFLFLSSSFFFFLFLFGVGGWESSCKFSCVFKAFSF